MKLQLSHGATYGTDKDGNRVCTGSQMGRRNVLPDDPEASVKLQLVRLWFVDDDYDQGGAYWGGGRGTEPLYCAFDEQGTRIFVRAKHRAEAKEKVREDMPNARFYR